jgi:hypothetical protein
LIETLQIQFNSHLGFVPDCSDILVHLTTWVAVIGVFVVLEKRVIAAVRAAKALVSELRLFKKADIVARLRKWDPSLSSPVFPTD